MTEKRQLISSAIKEILSERDFFVLDDISALIGYSAKSIRPIIDLDVEIGRFKKNKISVNGSSTNIYHCFNNFEDAEIEQVSVFYDGNYYKNQKRRIQAKFDRLQANYNVAQKQIKRLQNKNEDLESKLVKKDLEIEELKYRLEQIKNIISERNK
jgi:predicted RNase H-like nuclease (RuvC/YqgF family)